MGKREEKKKQLAHSKKLVDDVRLLLWIVTVGGIALAFYCVYKDFTSSLPWVGAMVGLPWASHATICSFYLSKSKAENTAADGTGIVFAAAAAKNFMEEYTSNKATYNTYNADEYVVKETYDNEDEFFNSPPI